MKTYTVYRVTNPNSYASYKPLIRKGKPVTFKLEADAEKWLEVNPPKSTARPVSTFEVRRTIKGLKT